MLSPLLCPVTQLKWGYRVFQEGQLDPTHIEERPSDSQCPGVFPTEVTRKMEPRREEAVTMSQD